MTTLSIIVTILLSIVSLMCLAISFKQDMQMMQQNSYRNERYIKWLKMSGEASSISRLLIIAILITLLAFPFVWAQMLAVVILLSKFAIDIKRKYKKPVVFTKRVWRLYIADWVAAISIIVAVGFININYIPNVIIAIIAISYICTIVVNWAMAPVEKSINQGFVNDAKKILSSVDNITVVGITGSYGKTSTKHYLNRILSEKYNVLMTPGSYNTPMGVVRTIREMLQPYNDLFIVEMGAKNIGDIKEICDIVHPTIGIITAVGAQHLESFKTIENVQRTKFELIDELPSNGFAVVNNDFEYVANRTINNVEYKRYGVSNQAGADFVTKNIEYSATGTSFTIVGDNGEEIELHTKLVGECNISNLMGAVIVAMHLGVEPSKIQYAVSKIEQVEHRLNMKRTPNGITIIDDAFNSNPDGSRMALDVLSRMTAGKRIVITPGMIELGAKQEEYNTIFGKHITETCDIAIVVGKYNRDAILEGIANGNMPKENVIVVDTFNDAQAELMKIARAGDTVLYENDLPDTFK
ncbi:MAG: UDP-N-acetylmuramoyl-tripeptide--D-alanyl-D-alanine ligase [Muribaculaceae bacterium]|nr:UDP-N-acetylmuramoyl-tripeptide--D-alanyl-D-alanine ligase [Muribaculaceae bacterium]